MLDELILRFESYPPSSPTLSVYGKTGELVCYVGINAVRKYADLTCQDTDDVLKEMYDDCPNKCDECHQWDKEMKNG